jgi:hypothetical protein
VFYYFVYSVLFSVLILEFYSRYLIPISTTIQQVIKDHTPDSAIFYLSIGAMPITIIDINGIPRNNFSKSGLRRAKQYTSTAFGGVAVCVKFWDSSLKYAEYIWPKIQQRPTFADLRIYHLWVLCTTCELSGSLITFLLNIFRLLCLCCTSAGSP